MLRVLVFAFMILGKSDIIYGQGLFSSLLGLGGNDNQPAFVAPDNNQNLNDNNDVVDTSSTLAHVNDNGGNLGDGSNTGSYNQDQQTIDNPLLNNQGIHTGTGLGLVNSKRNPYNMPNRDNIYGNARQPSLLESQLRNKINQGTYDDDDVKLAGQKFPQLQSLLDKLKELNKQKELQQQQGLNHHTHKPRPSQSTTEDKTESIDTSKPHSGEQDSDKTATDESSNKQHKKFKVLTKKRFYYQAQPVRPDNEKKTKHEEVYYEE